jgi:hypothetical protein
MMDKHHNFGTASTAGMISDQHINMGLYGESHGRDDGQEGNVVTPEVHQHGGGFRPFFNLSNRCFETRWRKDIVGPLRTSGISRGSPSRGGLTWVPIARGANVQSVCTAAC